MNIITNPYISNNIKFKRTVLRRFKRNKIVPGIFLIRFANDPDQLEIIRADLFKQSYLKDEDNLIVGFAADYLDALDYITEITTAAVEIYSEPRLKDYLLR